jgi:nicotinamide mononucleotide transporter
MIQILGESFSILELIGTVFGIAGVWLTVKENIFCFPAGIVNVVLYAILFFNSKLYADASLQVVYVILLIYGWYQWSVGKKEDEELPVTKTSLGSLFILFFLCLALTIIIGSLFKYYTDASLPYVDSLTTSMSLIAQWMIARKKIENWLLWIAADIIYVGMYLFKNLYLTSILYFIFIVLAVIGYRQWKKDLELAVS